MYQQETNKNTLKLPALMLSLFVSQLSTAIAAETVYRCISSDGGIEFTQQPCSIDTQEEVLTIEDQLVGWETPRAVLKAKKKKQTSRKHKKIAASKAARKSKAKQEKECWKKKQKIDNIQHRLRRGYKAGQGVDLRRKRREYEAYLSTFCQ